MKKTLHIIGSIIGVAAIALMISACNNNPKKDQGLTLAAADTVGLAAFQNWKFQHERVDPSMYSVQPVSQPAPVRTTTARPIAKPKAVTPATTTKKKGWSKAAKGAAIGAGAGAIAGVLINKKNRVLGGVIGGVLGGGIGYGIGRGMDKKDGRY